MADPFGGVPISQDAPARFGVTPAQNDSVDLATVTRALYVGGSRDVKVTMVSGQVVTFVGVLAGSIMPVQVARVWSTGTTASNIVALW